MAKQKSGKRPPPKKGTSSKASDSSGLKLGRPSLSEGPKDGRSPLVAIRFPPAELVEIDALMTKHEVKTRSEMIRRLVEAGKAVLGKR